MLDKAKIIQLIGLKGLVIPKDLMSEFNADTFIIGATLSELVRDGKLKLTTVKIGGSPFYYLPNQIAKLQELNKYLNEKDQRAFNLLKEKKVLKDSELTPIQRVSMRAIKDFAQPIEVKTQESTEIFWRWYLLTHQECIDLIKENYFQEQKQPIVPLQSTPQQIPVKTTSLQHTPHTTSTPPTSQISQTPSTNLTSSTFQTTSNVQTPPTQKNSIHQTQINQPLTKHQPIKQQATSSPLLTQQQPNIQSGTKGHLETKEQSEIKPTIKEKIKAVFDDMTKQKKETKEVIKPKQEIKKPKRETKPPQIKKVKSETKDSNQPETTDSHQKTLFEEPTGELYKKTKKYFNRNNIKLNNIEVIRKDKDMDCIVEIPSPVGVVEYYCKIKSKKKCNDGDLATAYVNAQMKNLPALFITTGEVTKKAQEMLKTKFKNMKIINLR